MAPKKKGAKGKADTAGPAAAAVAAAQASAAATAVDAVAAAEAEVEDGTVVVDTRVAPPPTTLAAAQKLALELDKKTKPIYDALDVRNYKAALKLIAGATAKHGNQPILLTLKAIALERTGHRNEALALCHAVQQVQPTDSKLLNALTIVYKCCDLPHEATVAYENACRRAPDSHELALQLYFAYGRENNFAKQQTQAMTLYKHWKDVKYLFWSALCLLLQPKAAVSAGLLNVAELMISRALSARPPNDAIEVEHLLIYLRILLRQNKFDAALTLLASPLAANYGKALPLQAAPSAAAATATAPTAAADTKGDDAKAVAKGKGKEKGKDNAQEKEKADKEKADKEKADKEKVDDERKKVLGEQSGYYTPADRKRSEADIYQSLGKTARVAAIYQQLLTDPTVGDADDWSYWTSYFDAAFAAIAAPADAKSAAADAATTPAPTVDSLRATVAAVQAAEAKLTTPARRGPYLADLELERRLLAAKLTSGTDRLCALLTDYFRRFGTKSMFFWDVSAYVDVLPRDAAQQLVTTTWPALIAQIEADASKPACAENRVRRWITVYQLQRYTGCSAAASLASSSSSASSDAADAKAAAPVALAGADAETNAAIGLAKRLFDQFMASQKLAKNLEPTERGAGDALLVLCVHVLLSAVERVGAGSPHARPLVLDAIACLEVGLTRYSKFNFQYKLLLTRLYAHPLIGAASESLRHWGSLESRFVQLDTATHFVLDDLVRYGLVSLAQAQCSEVAMFHHTHRRDGPEMMTMAYRNANYSKVLEFAEFNERLRRSHQAVHARLQLAHCQWAVWGNAAQQQQDEQQMRDSALANIDSELMERPAVAAVSAAAAAAAAAANPAAAAAAGAAAPAAAAAAVIPDLDFNAMLANQDYGLMSCWEPRDSLVASRLNRPAPSTYASSWDVPGGAALVKPAGAATYAIGDAQRAFARLRYWSLWVLKALLSPRSPQFDDAKLRYALRKVQSALLELGLVASADACTHRLTPAVASAAVAANTVDDAHWSLAYAVLELGVTVRDHATVASDLLARLRADPKAAADSKSAPAGSTADAAAALKDLTARLDRAAQQLGSVGSSIEQLVKWFEAALLLPAAAANAAAADTPRAVDPTSLVRASALLTHALRYFSFLVPVWEMQFPAKKAYRKGYPVAAGRAADLVALEDGVLDAFQVMRGAVKAAADTAFSALQRLVLLFTANAQRPAKAFAYAAPVSVLGDADVSATAATVLGGIADAHRVSLASLVSVLHAVQQPLATKF